MDISEIKKIVTGLIIFLFTLFCYIHILFHSKKSNDLEIYEIDNNLKDKFETVCDLRQPVIAPAPEELHQLSEILNIENLSKQYGVLDVNIIHQEDQTNINDDVMVNLPMSLAVTLFSKSSKYYSSNNSDYLTESGLIKYIKQSDIYLRPNFVSECNYDIMFGIKNITTPLKYDINYRNYYVVMEGNVDVILIPPKHSKYLNEIKNYEKMEYVSPINPWDVDKKYVHEYSKTKQITIKLRKGQILYVPAYWWSSIRMMDNINLVSVYKYKTYTNYLSIIPNVCLYFLQNLNIKHKTEKIYNEESNKHYKDIMSLVE
jgi:hypothetical protein